MGCITKIAAVENANAIWEYDPSLPNNRILGASLDVIAAIRTIAVKVGVLACLHPPLFLPFSQIQASGQRIEYFEKLQLQCKFDHPLRIPLHSNIRWGSAQRMLERSHKLRKVRSLHFQTSAAMLTQEIFSRSTYSSSQLTPCSAPLRQSVVMVTSKRRSHGPRLPSQRGIGNGLPMRETS
jgi:hypothetical protein